MSIMNSALHHEYRIVTGWNFAIEPPCLILGEIQTNLLVGCEYFLLLYVNNTRNAVFA